MKQFIDDGFVLTNPTALKLYQGYAKSIPIVDYHSHLSPKDIAIDRRYSNLTELWLDGDHYKWRAMRANGISEEYCSGKADPWRKFEKWAETVPFTLRNPLYHWTHLELGFPFGIRDRLLNPLTAKSIWDDVNSLLATPEYSCRGLLKKFNVRLLCTTDDPADSLEWHTKIKNDESFRIQVLPTFRPDKAFLVEFPEFFNEWLDKMVSAAGMEINDYDSMLTALQKRMDVFAAMGCRVSDHGFESLSQEDPDKSAVRSAFKTARSGKVPSLGKISSYQAGLMHELGLMYHKRNWVMQLHLGALRNTNTRMFNRIGRDSGFDTIGEANMARPLARLLDRLDRNECLPKTILFNLNPKDNDLMAAMTGNFQDGRIPGKIQYGSGWWFLDQKQGIEQQLNAISNHGLLSRFAGMLTDSRSFLSFSRHDYFRRILCNVVGKEMEQGLLPADIKLAGGMVRDICFNNTVEYFGFDVVRE